MRILDRYIAFSIIRIFLAMLLSFCLLYVLIDSFSHLDDFLEKKIPFTEIALYYLSFLPVIFVNTSPIACLIATLLSYSQLSSHNEIIALRANGLNFFKIARPALCFGLVVSVGIFYINERFVPQSTLLSQNFKEERIKSSGADKGAGAPVIIPNLTFYGLNNRLYFIDAFNATAQELQGITIIGHDKNQNLIEKITASHGVWTGSDWKFFNCQSTSFPTHRPNQPADIKTFAEKSMDIRETPQDFLKQRLDVATMNLRQLREYIHRFSDSGAVRAINERKVDYYQKFSFPLRSIIILVVGLPFALTTTRRKAMTFTSIGIAIAIGFLYYVVDAVGLAYGKGGGLPPLLSAWIAPLIFLAAAALLIRKNF